MSADEFDPAIERLFSRAPVMTDSAAFAASVEARLGKGARYRNLVLGLAGAFGGVVAVREGIGGRIHFAGGEDSGLLVDGLASAPSLVQSLLANGLGAAGAADAGFGSMGAMQLFWIAAAALAALAALGVMKLSQEI